MIGPLGISTIQHDAGTLVGLSDATCMAAAVALVPTGGRFARQGAFVLQSSHAPKLLLCPHHACQSPPGSPLQTNAMLLTYEFSGGVNDGLLDCLFFP
jgi:hypothetical protein